ncbi:hypothetical protein [Bradyrhizobium sp. SZCCHNRI20481]|uniref:hypothetical protein n=1 Tax=Bradyrhizobium sp. SZCCHNRI20481 TaxID=3057286 RepID=UPI0029170299|nr:hypothetical protein [Bradyrhizobium sp. SZCCHNRI20481]
MSGWKDALTDDTTVFGALGGLSPQLARMITYGASDFGAAAGSVISLTPQLILVFVLVELGLAALGAIAAHGLLEKKSQTRRGAMAAGIAGPAILAQATLGFQDARHPLPPIVQPTPQQRSLTSYSFIGSAKADDSDVQRTLQSTIDRILMDKAFIKLPNPRTLLIVATNDKAAQSLAHICYLTKDEIIKLNASTKGKETPEITCLDQELFRPKDSSFTTFQVPDAAVAVMVDAQLFALDKPSTTIGLQADVKPTFTGDLLWALGGRRVESVVIAPKELSSPNQIAPR